VKPNCDPVITIFLTIITPGYADGTNADTDIANPLNTVFTIPHRVSETSESALLEIKVSFAHHAVD
jgi:hypothetical protein